MHRGLKPSIASLCLALGFLHPAGGAALSKHKPAPPMPAPQETGFLNRKIEWHGAARRFQVYLPEDFHKDDHKQWPVILFLHGRGERGSEGMWQTQIALPMAVRDHPDRWPFIMVLPQCSYPNFWTDADMLTLAMAELDQEVTEFNADPARTYLTGISMGGYGAWELAKMYPKRWAAIVIASGGPFWSYAPERWQQAATLPAEYARAVGDTPVWLFHGSEDNVVPERESELMFSALKSEGGHVRLWIYQGFHHDSWTRAFNEPELPRWMLAHHLGAPAETVAEREVLNAHPNAIKLPVSVLDSLAGEYREDGHLAATIYREGDLLFQKDPHGEVTELEAESSTSLYYPNGGTWTRLLIEKDAEGRVTGLIYRDDRHSEHWERVRPTLARKQ